MSINSLGTIVNSTSICQTPECVNTAKSILEYVDFNIDPCSDFYEYSCGSWLKKAVIQDFKSSNGTLEEANDVNARVMQNILESTYDDAYQNLLDSYDGFHKEDQAEEDRENFELMQNYYHMCMDTSNIDALGPTPIYQDIATIQNSFFPVNDETLLFTKKDVPMISKTLAALQYYEISTLNNFYVDADDKNPNMNIILFDQVTLGLPSKEYYEDPANLEKYKKGLNDLIYKILGDNSSDAVRITESKKQNLKLWTKEKVASAVDRFINFETQLANISLKNEDMQDPIKVYNPIKLVKFQETYPMVDWVSIINSLIINNIKTPDTVIIRPPEYYEKLNKLLPTVKLITLQEYFMIQYIFNKVHTLDSSSRDAYRQMTGDIFSGVKIEQPRWRICVSYTSNKFSNIIGRFYTLKKFGSEKERIKAEKMLTSIHDAWIDRLNSIDWLDEQTRQKAIEKAELIKHKVGYSIISPDIRQPKSIKDYYNGLEISKKSFYDTENNISAWNSRKSWKKVGMPVDKDEWFMSPQTVNAYYAPNLNEIVIPAGILQSPIYSANYPDYLNYGGIGMVIGHELTHAFDSLGRKYDGYGNLVDWWTNATSARFENQTKCFIDQYAKFNVTGPENKIVNVNGKLTLAENLADNGGVTASLAAYKKFISNNSDIVLPELEKLSSEALFFINFGRAWCKKQRDKAALQMIYVDSHSPSSARVNGVAQNSDTFAKTFNCPVGSPMNPAEKCKIW